MKSDTKALLLAYLGCLVITALLVGEIIYSKSYYDLVLYGCIGLFGARIIKDSDSWELAIKKIGGNLKDGVQKKLHKV